MKKVLILTYYWPPAGGPGVQRVLKFAKYLPEFGWEPIILTVDSGEYPAIDQSLLQEIPSNLKVYKTKSFEPFNVYKNLSGQKGNIPTHVLSKSSRESSFQKLSKWIRANVFIPDARIGWIPSIVKEGLKIVEQEMPDVILSSSPPHSLQLGAMKLAKRTGLKWVADFRDPWTDGFWQKDLPRTFYALKKDFRLEKNVLQNADAVISVSQSITKLLLHKVENNYHVIPNGFDESDFENVQKIESDYFEVVYAGSLRESQIPFKLFNALAELNEKKQIEKLRLRFIGTLHPDAKMIIEKKGLSDITIINGYMPHSELLSYMISADILLLAIPDTMNNEGILTGKLFEYIAAKNFILGFGPTKGDAAKIIDELDAGIMLEYSDDPSAVILERYDLWKTGETKELSNDSEKYTRRNLTGELSRILESVL